MEKRLIFVLEFILAVLILISLCSFVSATYICSDGSQLSKDTREINELTKKSINGLGIAVIQSDEALNRIAADLIIDAEKVSLSNATAPENIELLEGIYEVKLINTSNSMAQISINGSSREINEREYDVLKGLQVFVVEANREPDVLTADVIIGVKKLSLSSTGNTSQIVVINGKNYSVELISASDNSANLGVGICGTGSIIEEQQQINNTNQSNINQTAGNESQNLTAGNGTSQNITNITSQNLTNATNNATTNITADADSKKTSIIRSRWFWVFVIAIVVIIVAFIIYGKMKGNREAAEKS
jgi:hypothetical protein